MPKIMLKADKLNEINTQYTHTRLEKPLFLNSVPKCGSHLMRNIMRLFVPYDQHYKNTFIQFPTLKQDKIAWDIRNPTLSWGHLLFSDESCLFLKDATQIVLVRDPYDWVLARARFFMSDEFQGSIDHIKGGRVSTGELLNMMIFGIHMKVPMLKEIFMHNGASWVGTQAQILKYEDLIKNLKEINTQEGEIFFKNLLSKSGINPIPADWKERVLEGSDRKHSGTARENLSGTTTVDIPKILPDAHKRLVDFAAPGLRKLLGYN
ncbi:MAG: hypothetical protein ACKVIX_04260 [Sphingomonadales bacterium]